MSIFFFKYKLKVKFLYLKLRFLQKLQSKTKILNSFQKLKKKIVLVLFNKLKKKKKTLKQQINDQIMQQKQDFKILKKKIN